MTEYDATKLAKITERREAAPKGPYHVEPGIVICDTSTRAIADFLAGTWTDVGYLLSLVAAQREAELLFDKLFAAWQDRLWVASRKVKGDPDLGMETIVQIIEKQLDEFHERQKITTERIRRRDYQTAPTDPCISLYCFHAREYHAPNCVFSGCVCKEFEEAPTEAEAEAILREQGIDPEQLSNNFIEHLFKHVANQHEKITELESEVARLKEENERKKAASAEYIARTDADIERLANEVERLQKMNGRWKAAVEGLTPSGSEYVDDPEACAAAIRHRTRWPKQIIEARAENERLEAEVTRLKRRRL